MNVGYCAAQVRSSRRGSSSEEGESAAFSQSSSLARSLVPAGVVTALRKESRLACTCRIWPTNIPRHRQTNMGADAESTG